MAIKGQLIVLLGLLAASVNGGFLHQAYGPPSGGSEIQFRSIESSNFIGNGGFSQIRSAPEVSYSAPSTVITHSAPAISYARSYAPSIPYSTPVRSYTTQVRSAPTISYSSVSSGSGQGWGAPSSGSSISYAAPRVSYSSGPSISRVSSYGGIGQSLGSAISYQAPRRVYTTQVVQAAPQRVYHAAPQVQQVYHSAPQQVFSSGISSSYGAPSGVYGAPF